MKRVLLALAALVVALVGPLHPTAAPAAPAAPSAAPARINGSGSTYVGPAMTQWIADAYTEGLQINYLPNGSPQGLTAFDQSLVDFAGTEAEFSALGISGDSGRGFQYVPDVAGAVAILYNVEDRAGRRLDSLHLSRSTVAKIFMGFIDRWSDPAITADNNGLQLPDEPITVVYRGSQSGTTALFYDFVAETEPSLFAQWADEYELPTHIRIIQLDSVPDFAPHTLALSGSDQIAQHVAGGSGLWSIAYDEFAYALTYDVPAAWIENQSGEWVLPYAENISAALESARLRPDLSQELSGVYASTNPLAYPISAYSYIVTQCVESADRPTCRGPYVNRGVAETLAIWLRYIACDGQITMADTGYSPLPPNLSQEMANSIGRMLGQPPEQLTAANCGNPRFGGSLGEGAQSPPDPIGDGGGGGSQPTGGTGNNSGGGGGSGSGSGGGGGSGSGGASGSGGGGSSDGSGDGSGGGGGDDGSGGGSGDGSGSGGTTGGTDGAAPAAVGRSGRASAVGGGSEQWRDAAPAAYERPAPGDGSVLPLLLLLVLVVVPPVGIGIALSRRRD